MTSVRSVVGGKRAAELRYLTEQRQKLATFGHWSMRRKTEVLNDIVRRVLDDEEASPYFCKGALWTVASAGHQRLAIQLFKELDDRKVLGRGDTSLFDAVLKSHAVAATPEASAVRGVWRSMLACNARPTKRTLDLMCLALDRSGHSTAAAQIASEARSMGIPVETPAWNAARTPAAATCEGRTPSASEACLTVLRYSALRNDVLSAETAVSDLVSVHSGTLTLGHWIGLMRVYAGRGDLGPVSPAVPFGYDGGEPLAAGRRDPQGLQGVWARFVTQGGAPDEWAFDYLLLACAKVAGREAAAVKLAERAFEHADSLRLTEEQHLWARLMQVYAAAREAQAAEVLLRRMWGRGHRIKRSSRVMLDFRRAATSWLMYDAA
ncbi:hypothetical protein DIPPA_18945 [Diplonema papillatum]|nr:hypothetical protein DIPPA_18945 [Diplonema papillatum]